MTNFYVYAHYNPDSKEPFYIGKGKDSPNQHVRRAYKFQGRSSFWNGMAKKGVEVVILHDELTEQSAFDLEANYIACYGRRDLGEGCLVNLTDGYDGVYGLSELTRKRMRENHKGMTGRKHNDITKEKCRLASLKTAARRRARGERHPTFGKKRPPEVGQKIRLKMLGNKRSAESIEKGAAKRRGRPLTKEHCANIGAALRGRKWTTEQYRKMSATMKGRKHSPETIAKLRLRRHTPETLAKLKAIQNNPLHRKHLSDVQKGRKFTEEHKRKLKENHGGGMRGMHHTPEARRRISEARKEYYLRLRGKTV